MLGGGLGGVQLIVRNRALRALNPKPGTPNPKPQTLNPKTLNPKP